MTVPATIMLPVLKDAIEILRIHTSSQAQARADQITYHGQQRSFDLVEDRMYYSHKERMRKLENDDKRIHQQRELMEKIIEGATKFDAARVLLIEKYLAFTADILSQHQSVLKTELGRASDRLSRNDLSKLDKELSQQKHDGLLADMMAISQSAIEFATQSTVIASNLQNLTGLPLMKLPDFLSLSE